MSYNFLALYVFAICMWCLEIVKKVGKGQKVSMVTYLVMFTPCLNVLILFIKIFTDKEGE